MPLSDEPSRPNRTADTLVHFVHRGMLVANLAVIEDYGLRTREHYEAIFSAVRSGDITADDLHTVAGDGPGLTTLLRSAPSNPHKDVTFKTVWDDFSAPIPQSEFPIQDGRIEGKEIARLMRKHRVTIRELAGRMQITMKRIRQVRTDGLDDRNVIRDWIQHIIGRDPGPV